MSKALHHLSLCILNPVIGKIQLQKFFEALYMFSLVGMGYGGFANLRSTGETATIKYVLTFPYRDFSTYGCRFPADTP
jgi:hypothetical protein